MTRWFGPYMKIWKARFERRERNAPLRYRPVLILGFLAVNKNEDLYSILKIYFELKESIRQKQRGELEEVLKIRDQDLENTLSKQKEVGVRILLRCIFKV